MPTFRVVPWESPDDLIRLGRLFFRSGELNADSRQLHEACNTVSRLRVVAGC